MAKSTKPEKRQDSFDVQPFDLGRYTVRSQSTSEHYLVSVLEFDGFGTCTCPDWSVRCGPARRAGTEPEKPWCKHIAACRTHLTWEVIRRMIANEKAQEVGH